MTFTDIFRSTQTLSCNRSPIGYETTVFTKPSWLSRKVLRTKLKCKVYFSFNRTTWYEGYSWLTKASPSLTRRLSAHAAEYDRSIAFKRAAAPTNTSTTESL